MPESLARVSPLTDHVPEMTALVRAFSELRKQNARAIGTMAARHGISATDLRALSFIHASDGATPKATAEHLGITTGSLTTLADRLETAGYLVRTAHPDDRRSVVLQPTAAGAAIIAEANHVYIRAFSEACEPEDAAWMSQAFLDLAAALGRLAD